MSYGRIAFALMLSVTGLSGLVGCHKHRDNDAAPGKPVELHSVLLDNNQRRGLNAEGNDPATMALAHDALACPADGSSLFETSCAAYKAWRAMEVKDRNTETTLINLIEDPNERVRYLGAKGLSDAKTYRSDLLLAKRVVAAATAEKSKELYEVLGERVARIDVAKTGLLPSITALVNRPAITNAPIDGRFDMSLAIVGDLLFTNSDDRPTYDFFLSLTKDQNTKIRSKAVGAFWVGGSLSRSETCKVWESHLEDPDGSIAAHSAMLLGWYHSCSTSYDTLLTSLESRIKTGRLGTDSDISSASGKMCGDTKATAAQKQRGAAISRNLASNKDLHTFVRSNAIRSVVDCDPKGGRAFVVRFKNDKESIIRDAVKDALTTRK